MVNIQITYNEIIKKINTDNILTSSNKKNIRGGNLAEIIATNYVLHKIMMMNNSTWPTNLYKDVESVLNNMISARCLSLSKRYIKKNFKITIETLLSVSIVNKIIIYISVSNLLLKKENNTNYLKNITLVALSRDLTSEEIKKTLENNNIYKELMSKNHIFKDTIIVPYIDKLVGALSLNNNNKFILSIIANTNWILTLSIIKNKKTIQNILNMNIINTLKNIPKIKEILAPIDISFNIILIKLDIKSEDTLRILQIWAEAVLSSIKVEEQIDKDWHIDYSDIEMDYDDDIKNITGNNKTISIDLPYLIHNISYAIKRSNLFKDKYQESTATFVILNEFLQHLILKDLISIVSPRKGSRIPTKITFKSNISHTIIKLTYYQKPFLYIPNDTILHTQNAYIKNVEYGKLTSTNDYIHNKVNVFNTPKNWNADVLISKRSQKIINNQQSTPLCIDKEALAQILINTNNGYNMGKITSNKTKLLQNTMTMIDALIYAIIGKPFYMISKRDIRGRDYMIGTLSPTNTKFMRYILKFNNNILEKFNDAMGIDEETWYIYIRNSYAVKIKHNDTFDNIIKYNIENINIKDNIGWYNKTKNMKLKYDRIAANIELDATASVIQLIFTIFKNKKMLEKCGYFSKKKYIDPYTALIDTDNKKIITYIEFLYEKHKKNNKKILKTAFNINVIKNAIKNRSIQKNTIMTYIYGSKAWYIAEKNKLIAEKDNDNTDINMIDMFYATNYIIHNIHEAMKFELDALNALKHLNCIKKPIIFLNPYQTFANSYGVERIIKKRINIFQPKGGKITTLNLEFPQTSDSTDTRKSKISFAANLIHYHDAFIVSRLKEQMYYYKNSTNLISIHDAFIMEFNHSQYILKEYNITLTQIFHSNKILNTLIEEFDEKKEEISKIEISKISKVISIFKTRKEDGSGVLINGIFNLKP